MKIKKTDVCCFVYYSFNIGRKIINSVYLNKNLK